MGAYFVKNRLECARNDKEKFYYDQDANTVTYPEEYHDAILEKIHALKTTTFTLGEIRKSILNNVFVINNDLADEENLLRIREQITDMEKTALAYKQEIAIRKKLGATRPITYISTTGLIPTHRPAYGSWIGSPWYNPETDTIHLICCNGETRELSIEDETIIRQKASLPMNIKSKRTRLEISLNLSPNSKKVEQDTYDYDSMRNKCEATIAY